MTKVAILGAGAFGTSLAAHFAKMAHEVFLWAFEKDLPEKINGQHKNEDFLPGVTLPASIRCENDFDLACRDAALVIFACPSRFMRRIAAEAAPYIQGDTIVAVVSKGIENETHALMTEILDQCLANTAPGNICAISGPSFAIEVAEGLPTDIVAASPGFLAARKVQKIMHAPFFRVYTSDDPVGVQLGGSLKNVIAIAAGVCDEFGLGYNARAALITRGLTEMTRLGMAKGANPITFLGLAGIGDLILTCTGDLSRNRTLGRRLARGESPQEIIANSKTVSEGFYAAKSAYNMSLHYGVDMPITQQVYAVLYEGKTILDASRELMSREFKNEFKGIIHA